MMSSVVAQTTLAVQSSSSQPAQHAATGTTSAPLDLNGGRFDFDDGGTYCGGWEDGKAHGHGVCTGPKGQGEYAGSWHYGFEVSGVYTWPSGSTYEGHWQNGKRHGLGVEARGRWLYRGEWTQGFKGRYGARQSTVSMARYEGTWANGLQDGYGSETYADGGTYQGQWLRGMRHGYGARTSAPFGLASHQRHTSGGGGGIGGSSGGIGGGAGGSSDHKTSGLTTRDSESSLNAREDGGQASVKRSVDSEGRGGFVLRSKSDEAPRRRRSLVERSGMKSFVQGLKLKKQRSTGDLDRKGVTSIRSTGSSTSWMSSESGYTAASAMSEGSNQSFILEDEQLDPSVTETYMGEWKNDKRSGFGISERSDGLKYEGEWYNNRKYGYGVTTFRDGAKEEGKYKNNILVTSNQKRHLFLIRSAKFRERIDSALNAASRASKIALQKADIAISRTATARGKAEQADVAAIQARQDGHQAVQCAQQYQEEIENATPAPNPNQLRPELYFKDNSFGHNTPSAPAAHQAHAPLQPNAIHGPHNPMSPASPNSAGTPTFQTSPDIPSSHKAPAPGGILGALRSFGPPELTDLSSQRANKQLKPNGNPSMIGSEIQHQSNHSRPKQMGNQVPLSPRQEDKFRLQDPPPSDRRFSDRLHQQQQPVTGGGRQQYSASPSAMNCDMTVDSGGGGGYQQHQHHSRPSRLSNARGMYASGSNGGSQEHQQRDGEHFHFQRIMDDHFEHYRRPPSRPGSREASVDRMPASLAEASVSGGGPRVSRPPSRASSRSRAPMLQRTARMPSTDDSRLDSRLDFRLGQSASCAANGELSGGSRDSSAVRYRGGAAASAALSSAGIEPSQEIYSMGTVPKRTESLYVKYGREDSKDQIDSGLGPYGLQRKKSLPDVQNLATVASSSQGSREMTREEISVLSSSRRDHIRRQMEDVDRYKSNPLMYIFNPRVQEWLSRQQLVLLVLFINLTLAFMFFKLLT